MNTETVATMGDAGEDPPLIKQRKRRQGWTRRKHDKKPKRQNTESRLPDCVDNEQCTMDNVPVLPETLPVLPETLPVLPETLPPQKKKKKRGGSTWTRRKRDSENDRPSRKLARSEKRAAQMGDDVSEKLTSAKLDGSSSSYASLISY